MKTDLSSSPKLEDLEIPDIPAFIQKQREFFDSGATFSYEFRKQHLKLLYRMINENQEAIVEAVNKDMGRPAYESYAADVGIVLTEIKYALKHLKRWMKPKKVNTGIAFFKSSAAIERIPFGVALVVSAWNYPVYTLIRPLVSVLAAGNTAILKPSELSVHSSKLIDKLVDQYFPDKIVEVIPGGPETGQAMLHQNFDLIVFTGSTRVGRLYAEAAAKTLTPIILELGGKSPSIIDKTAKLKVAVDRILQATFFNASQTCVAVDYLIVHEDIKAEFTRILKETLDEVYGSDAQTSPDYGRIINIGHYNRIKGLYDEVADKAIYGGTFDESELYIAPTLIDQPSMDSRIMQEEIFGPVLPILTFKTEDDIRTIIKENETPLTLYIFSEEKKFINSIKSTVQCGDMCINEAAIHGAIPGLKFGGIGTSGMGAYGGEYGFSQCSHHRSVLKRSTLIHTGLTSPPYTSFKQKLLKMLLK